MSQFEGFLNDVARVGDAMRARSAANSYEREIARLDQALARSYGVRSAAFEQLRKLDPNNPILKDEELRKRIGDAAESAYFSLPGPDGVRHYDRAREVGRAFKIPGR